LARRYEPFAPLSTAIICSRGGSRLASLCFKGRSDHRVCQVQPGTIRQPFEPISPLHRHRHRHCLISKTAAHPDARWSPSSLTFGLDANRQIQWTSAINFKNIGTMPVSVGPDPSLGQPPRIFPRRILTPAVGFSRRHLHDLHHLFARRDWAPARRH